MTRSSFVIRTIGLGLLLAGSYACGGEAPPPKPPETLPAEDAGEATPPPATETSDAGAAAATDTAPPPPPAPAALALPSGSAKLKVKTSKDFDLEIKSDGTVNSGGKPAAKITGMELQDKDGKTQLKVDSDGNITTADGASYAKFDGDILVANTGAKWMIAEDGAFKTADKGAEKAAGKTTDVGSAKKAALLSVAFVTWGTKAPQPAAAKTAATPATGTAKAGDKTAADKPADKKPADKAADKKPADKPAAAPKK